MAVCTSATASASRVRHLMASRTMWALAGALAPFFFVDACASRSGSSSAASSARRSSSAVKGSWGCAEARPGLLVQRLGFWGYLRAQGKPYPTRTATARSASRSSGSPQQRRNSACAGCRDRAGF